MSPVSAVRASRNAHKNPKKEKQTNEKNENENPWSLGTQPVVETVSPCDHVVNEAVSKLVGWLVGYIFVLGISECVRFSRAGGIESSCLMTGRVFFLLECGRGTLMTSSQKRGSERREQPMQEAVQELRTQ